MKKIKKSEIKPAVVKKIQPNSKSKRVWVDQKTCIGCGVCTTIAPKVFELGKNGKSKVKNPEGADLETIKLAVDACPVQAIKIRAGKQFK